MSKGCWFRKVDPVRYEKNYQRMDGVCNTCVYFLGDDSPMHQHCESQSKYCEYEEFGPIEFIVKLVDEDE